MIARMPALRGAGNGVRSKVCSPRKRQKSRSVTCSRIILIDPSGVVLRSSIVPEEHQLPAPIVLLVLQLPETLVPFGENLDGVLLILEDRRLEAFLEGIDDADPPGHSSKLLLDTQQGDLNVEQHLVAFADLPEQFPVVGLEGVAVLADFGERLAGHLLVDCGEAIVKLMLLVQPEPSDFVSSSRVMS